MTLWSHFIVFQIIKTLNRPRSYAARLRNPPRQALTCRVKSEDLHGTQTALIPSAVFNFPTLSIMHGHNRQAEVVLPRPLGSGAEARGGYEMQREQIEVARTL